MMEYGILATLAFKGQMEEEKAIKDMLKEGSDEKKAKPKKKKNYTISEVKGGKSSKKGVMGSIKCHQEVVKMVWVPSKRES